MLEKFKVMDNLESTTPSLPSQKRAQNLYTKMNREPLFQLRGGVNKKSVVVFIVFLLVTLTIVFVFLFYQFQETLFSELRLERDERARIEKQRAKTTEEWFQKTNTKMSEALNSISALEQTIKEQQETLRVMSEKVESLEKAEQARNLKKTMAAKKKHIQ